ncbi:hypothetical protein F4810DRAFT_717890 [Camillea tinctor]|nr:hypothetical protein F4810DRAFT_717890 [Camillea tinctor]
MRVGCTASSYVSEKLSLSAVLLRSISIDTNIYTNSNKNINSNNNTSSNSNINNSTVIRTSPSAGDKLWRHQKKKKLLEPDAEKIQLWRPSDSAAAGCLLALYARCDGLSNKKRPLNWRRNVLDYYQGRYESYEDVQEAILCHISGQWWSQPTVKAAHIVPFFANSKSACPRCHRLRLRYYCYGLNQISRHPHPSRLLSSYV